MVTWLARSPLREIFGQPLMGDTEKEPGNRALGEFLKAARLRAGLTQKQVAEAAETTDATVQRVEAGKRGTKRPMLVRLVKAVGADEKEALDLWAQVERQVIYRDPETGAELTVPPEALPLSREDIARMGAEALRALMESEGAQQK